MLQRSIMLIFSLDIFAMDGNETVVCCHLHRTNYMHILRLSQVTVLAAIEIKHDDVICANPGAHRRCHTVRTNPSN